MRQFRPRSATVKDLSALLELAVDFYVEDGFTTPRDRLRTNLDHLVQSSAAHVAVVEEMSRLLAFAITTSSFGLEDGSIAELEDLYVAPSARGVGIGLALLDNSAAWSYANGCSHLEIVITHGLDHDRLRSYYGRAGFTEPRTLIRKSLP